MSSTDDLGETLRALRPPADEAGSWRPTLIPATDRAALAALVASGRVDRVHDTLRDQLGELVASLHPERRLSGAALDAAIDAHLAGTPLDDHGAWVWYPWTRRLVRALPADELRFLRSDRNRYKITPAEQARLRACRIGVVGLSVGRAAAVTLAQEGVGGHFTLADFDTLAVSNMNRLRGGLHDVGLRKTVLAAREIFEMDPYLSVSLFSDGLDPDNIDAFLVDAEGRKLDLLVEECDDLFIKVRVRERARALGIPVVMETSDRGLVDVERFDLEPARPVFHGLIGDVRAEALRGLETRDKIPYILRILDDEALSPRMRATLVEIAESVSTWPQLASAIALGGALVTDVGRRILLGQMTRSGRFYVDVEELVCDDTAPPMRAPPPLVEPVAPEALAGPDLPPLTAGAALTPDLVRALVARAVLAPSGGNVQPWRFAFDGEVLRCALDSRRGRTFLDFDGRASVLAMGAAVENLAIAAGAAGLRVAVRAPDAAEPERVCDLVFAPSDAPADPRLLDAVERRATNRRLGPRLPLEVADADALVAAAAAHGATLRLVTDEAGLAEAADVLADADRLIFFNERAHAGLVSELRWTAAEVERTRDGVDLATLDVTAVDRAGLRILSDHGTVRTIAGFGGGRGFGLMSRRAVAAASAVALVTVPGDERRAFFDAGRAVERAWLEATARGLGVQPLSALLYLVARAEAGADGFDDAERAALAGLAARYRRLFGVAPGSAEALLFRVARVAPPTVRALRRPVDEVLTFG